MRVPIYNDIFTLCDPEDHAELCAYKWRLNSYGYVVRTEHRGWSEGKRINHPVYIHRVILGLTDPKQIVDHINGDKLDNRRSNLRVCNRSQNGMNRIFLNKNNNSGHIGVFRDKERPQWKAVMGQKTIGGFDSLEEACAARLKEERRLFGEFAPIKRPKESPVKP